MMFGLELTSLIDAVLAVTVLEMLLLCVYRRVTGRGLPAKEFLANMVSGLCLMFALRALASDAGSVWVASGLLAAGLAHATDLWRRWHLGEVTALSSPSTSPHSPNAVAAAASPLIRVSQVNP